MLHKEGILPPHYSISRQYIKESLHMFVTLEATVCPDLNGTTLLLNFEVKALCHTRCNVYT